MGLGDSGLQMPFSLGHLKILAWRTLLLRSLFSIVFEGPKHSFKARFQSALPFLALRTLLLFFA